MKGKLRMFVEIGMIVLLLPFAFDGLKDARQIDYTQTAPAVVTAAVTTGNVTLVKELFLDDVVNVVEITSSNTTDVPVAATYNSGTRALTVGGLLDNATRTLYIDYGYARFDSGSDTLFGLLPLFLMFGLAYDVFRQLFSGRG
jgi:hypothetical protein